MSSTRRVFALLILAAAIAATPASAAEVFVSIDPCRVFDNRDGDGGGPDTDNPHPNGIGDVLTVPVVGVTCPGDSVPAGATAVSLTVIAVSPTATGFVSVYPEDGGFTGTSWLNFPVTEFANDNGGIMTLDDDGELGLSWESNPATPAGSNFAFFVVDVTGYFIELGIGTGGGFAKTDVYVNSQGGASPDPGEVYTRTASCNDGNDIALSGHCHSTGTDTSYIVSQELTNFDTTGAAASFKCDFELQGSNGNGQARIVCVDVP